MYKLFILSILIIIFACECIIVCTWIVRVYANTTNDPSGNFHYSVLDLELRSLS